MLPQQPSKRPALHVALWCLASLKYTKSSVNTQLSITQLWYMYLIFPLFALKKKMYITSTHTWQVTCIVFKYSFSPLFPSMPHWRTIQQTFLGYLDFGGVTLLSWIWQPFVRQHHHSFVLHVPLKFSKNIPHVYLCRTTQVWKSF